MHSGTTYYYTGYEDDDEPSENEEKSERYLDLAGNFLLKYSSI